MADKEPTSIWGDNYYVMGLTDGKYDIRNGTVYGPEYPNGIPADELLGIVSTDVKELRQK